MAKFVNEDSYALVFGFNFFLALVMQTILTTVVIEALKLGIRDQVLLLLLLRFLKYLFLVSCIRWVLFVDRRGIRCSRRLDVLLSTTQVIFSLKEIA